MFLFSIFIPCFNQHISIKLQVKESPKKKTPEKPKDKTDEEIPPSLEKKKSSYRSFMERDGPRALGSRELPQVTVLYTLKNNCF